MKLRVQQLNPIIGDIEGNTALIKEAISDAEAAKIELLLLPELVVCGYSPMDLLERTAFLDTIYQANEQIAVHTKETAVLFGTVTPNQSRKGRKCFNSALLAYDGEVQAEIHKTLLPTYDIYDELRYFEPNKSFECVEFKGRKIGVTICEDIWYNFGDFHFVIYDVNPARELVDRGAEAIFNLSASPYTRNRPQTRQEMLQGQVRDLKVPVFYANQVGGNADVVSDGDSVVIGSDEKVMARAPLFKEAFVDVTWDKSNAIKNLSPGSTEIAPLMEQMFHCLVFGLKEYLRKTQVADKVVIGLSGGLDSTLVACIAVEALGAENVVGITMPSEFSSTGSVSDSEKLADNLGIKLHQISIKEIYEQFNESLNPLFRETSFGIAEENLQPRIRAILLMAYSNKFGAMLLNTGNKSELAMGYSTLYGDMAGGLAVISDLYKTEVFEMARWLNFNYFKFEIIPESVLTKPPSAELRPHQKDTDSLPAYETLDAILKAYIEEHCSKSAIIDRGFEKRTVDKVTAMVDRMEYKRAQAAPGLKVSDKAFGSGRRWPMVQRWTNNA
ncbi:MAG TPA: NAD+ synthase [Balneolaceae bacterium]|nr:NAD+ synthase [Balneolaceae bacterium]